MSNEELATRIISLLGGKDNILTAENCMTRIRVNIKDASLADRDGIKNTQGVLGVVGDEHTYLQVVLGPGKVRDVMNIFTTKLGVQEHKNQPQGGQSQKQVGDWEANKKAVKSSQKHTKLINKVRVLADIFTPMIPAFIASGICNGLGKVIKIMMGNGMLPDVVAVACASPQNHP